MIKTGIRSFRDPFVLVTDGAYYLYGTDVLHGWDDCTWGCYKNCGELSGKWEKVPSPIYEKPEHALKNCWAPEVHAYNGAYYMLASYFSSDINHRGCTILRSLSPEGPFVEITDGVITPRDWDCIDGTLYIDGQGAPWLVFVHEWTSTPDKVGTMAVARLTDDLSALASEPRELFRADSPSWTSHGCTDGPFIYKTVDGQLLMLWSNFIGKSYTVGIARSKDGRIDGEWTHDEKLLFSKEISGDKDGGHGMIFRDRKGDLYLSIHSPNIATAEEKEEVIFVPVVEENGTLVCKI